MFSGYLYVAPNKIDFKKISPDFEDLPPENAVALSTVCLIFVCYAVGLMFARRADNRDKRKVSFFTCSEVQVSNQSYISLT